MSKFPVRPVPFTASQKTAMYYGRTRRRRRNRTTASEPEPVVPTTNNARFQNEADVFSIDIEGDQVMARVGDVETFLGTVAEAISGFNLIDVGGGIYRIDTADLSWWSDSAYTVLYEADAAAQAGEHEYICSVTDGTASNRLVIYDVNSVDRLVTRIDSGGVLQANIVDNTPATSRFYGATASSANDIEAMADGVSLGTDGAAALPVTPDRIILGGSHNSALPWGTNLHYVALVPNRLSLAQTVALQS